MRPSKSNTRARTITQEFGGKALSNRGTCPGGGKRRHPPVLKGESPLEAAAPGDPGRRHPPVLRGESPLEAAAPGDPGRRHPPGETLVLPAHAKLNLDLAVLGVRPDGFHEIWTRFQAISPHDLLQVEPAPATALIGGSGDDLVLRAQRALEEACQRRLH